jgi:protein required for attachment to host cells
MTREKNVGEKAKEMAKETARGKNIEEMVLDVAKDMLGYTTQKCVREIIKHMVDEMTKDLIGAEVMNEILHKFVDILRWRCWDPYNV